MSDAAATESSVERRPWWDRPLVVGGLLFAVAVALYGVSLQGPPQLDDRHTLALLEAGRLWESTIPPRRAIAVWSFVLSHGLHGTAPFGYHLFNVILHALTAFGVFCLVSAYLPKNRGAAHLAAWIFLCHPLATQGVTYMVQRYAVMAAMFAVWALWCVARGRQAGEAEGSLWRREPILWLVLATLLAVSAMFSKEYVAGLPFLVLAGEWLFFRKSTLRLRSRLLYLLPLLATVVVVPAVYLFMTADRVVEAEAAELLLPNWSAGAVPRKVYFLTQWKVILGTYFRLMAVPLGQSIDHGFSASSEFTDPVVLISGLILTAILIGGLALWRRLPLVTFGILVIFMALAPTSTVVQNSEFVAEHRCYLSLAGFAMVVACFIAMLRGWRRAAVAIVYCLALAGLTVHRNTLWADELALWQDAAEKAPEIPRPHFAVGETYRRQGDYDRAVEYYEKALAVRPAYYPALLNRAVSLETAGQTAAALRAYHELLKRYPTDRVGLKNLAFFFWRLEQPEKALIVLERYRLSHPQDAETEFFTAQALEALGRKAPAREAYEQTISLGSSRNLVFASRLQLGRLAAGAGDPESAALHFRAALELRPDQPKLILLLAPQLLALEQPAAAAAHLRGILPRVQGKLLARTHWLLADSLAQQGKDEAAAEHRRLATGLDPELAAPPDPAPEKIPAP